MKALRVISLLIVVDQITKWWMRTQLASEGKEILSFFRLEYVQNTGIAFSWAVPGWLIILLTFGVLFSFWWWWQKDINKYEKTAIVFIAGGAVGNLLDRLFMGAVTDFLSFWSFPIFNLADIWISVGVGLFFWGEVRGSEKSKMKNS
jgi:signal peptidase II